MFDKYKTCKDCPDRLPACHDDCDGYKFRCEKQAQINKKRRESKIGPTAHKKRAMLDFYKRQKKYRKLYKK